MVPVKSGYYYYGVPLRVETKTLIKTNKYCTEPDSMFQPVWGVAGDRRESSAGLAPFRYLDNYISFSMDR